jgi:hypothetical protein
MAKISVFRYHRGVANAKYSSIAKELVLKRPGRYPKNPIERYLRHKR